MSNRAVRGMPFPRMSGKNGPSAPALKRGLPAMVYEARNF